MALVAGKISSTWFHRLTMTLHPEPFGPEVLDGLVAEGLVEGCHNIWANNYAVMYRSLVILEGNSEITTRIIFLNGFIQLGKKVLLADFSPPLKYLIPKKEGLMFSYPTKAGSKAVLPLF
jgi:hypothetical protein